VTPGILLGLGLDLVDIDRFRHVLARRPGMIGRLFTAEEQAYASTFRDPSPTLAGRFAVKEAVMKALGVGLGAFSFTEVTVRRLDSGQPELAVLGAALDLARARAVGSWMVAISHTDTVASAVVAALA
jgi:holo-[acyl-carrier protein] synthase